MSQSDLMIMTTTFGDREKACEVARLLVDGGLAVCAQVGDSIESIYNWQGELCQEKEVRVTFKVLGERFELFCGELKLNHPYDVPQLTAWPSSYVDTDYLNWAKGKGKDRKFRGPDEQGTTS